MNPGAVLFPVLYDLWVAMLKWLECGCLSTISLQRDGDGDDVVDGENDEKSMARSVPDGSNNQTKCTWHVGLSHCVRLSS